MMYKIFLPIRSLKDICRQLVLSTEMIFSTHFSATKIPTPPKPDLSPDHKNLYLQCLPVIILVEQPLQRVSWTAQISILLLAKVSTISLALPRMVPTFRDAIRSLNLFCRISHDIDLTGPTFTPGLPLRTRSLQVPVPFSYNNIRHDIKTFRFEIKILLPDALPDANLF